MLANISPVYDFTTINKTTLSFHTQDFYELSHFTPACGERIIQRIAGEDNGFGDLLNADNAQRVLKAQHTAYSDYRTSAHYKMAQEYSQETFERLINGTLPSAKGTMARNPSFSGS